MSNKIQLYEDSGWVKLDLESDNFDVYDEYDTRLVRKLNGVVELNLSIKPLFSETSSATEKLICTLPEGYRPYRALYILCQGSSTQIWLLTIRASGAVYYSRHRSGASYVTTTGTEWLAGHAVFTASS